MNIHVLRPPIQHRSCCPLCDFLTVVFLAPGQLPARRKARLGTWGPGDLGTWVRGDVGTWGPGDPGTWGLAFFLCLSHAGPPSGPLPQSQWGAQAGVRPQPRQGAQPQPRQGVLHQQSFFFIRRYIPSVALTSSRQGGALPTPTLDPARGTRERGGRMHVGGSSSRG